MQINPNYIFLIPGGGQLHQNARVQHERNIERHRSSIFPKPLQSLDLSSNFLSGEIPPSVGKSGSYLSTLALANNNLSGPIPNGTQIQSMSEDSFLPGNEGLCGSPLKNKPCAVLNNETRNASQSFSDAIAIPGFVAGNILGFLAVAVLCLTWGPAIAFIRIGKLKKRNGKGSSTGLWRPP